MCLVGLIACLAFVAFQAPAGGAESFYSAVDDHCLAVEEQQSADVGSTWLALAVGQKPVPVSVDAVVPWAGRSTDRRPRYRTDCASGFQSGLEGDDGKLKQIRLAHLSPLPQDSFASDVTFAVPRSGAIVIGGKPVALGLPERMRLAKAARSSLPRNWRFERTLVHAYRYGPANGHAIVELYLGLPTLNPPGTSAPIKRISIRRQFLVDGGMVATEEYERASGVEERAETEAPELTSENWSQSTEETIGFISRDEGRSWETTKHRRRLRRDPLVCARAAGWPSSRIPSVPLHAPLSDVVRIRRTGNAIFRKEDFDSSHGWFKTRPT